MSAQQFIEDLFGTAPPGVFVNVFTLPDAHSAWITPPFIAPSFAQNKDVYFGPGLASKDYGPKLRTDEKTGARPVIGIPGVWADIDIAGPGHKKQNLPPDLPWTLGFLDTTSPMPPSRVVFSGGGVHAYWLFESVWMFEDAPAKEKAAAIVQGFQRELRRLLTIHNLQMDSTHDLTRILRLPGTFNNKHGEPVPVRLIVGDGPRYPLEAFEKYATVVAEERKLRREQKAATIKDGAYTLSSTAEPSPEKFEATCELEPRLRGLFEETIPCGDGSPSAYDLGLANIAVRCHWKDQEVVDLLIAHRRRCGHAPKLRSDYFELTLERAKQRRTPTQQAQVQGSPSIDRQSGEDLPRTPEGEVDHLRLINDFLHAGITSIVKFVSDTPEYTIEFDNGQVISVADVAKLTQQASFRNLIAAGANKYAPKLKPAMWDLVARSIFAVMVERTMGDLATPRGRGLAWIIAYLTNKPPRQASNDVFLEQMPYYQDGRAYIFERAFLGWLKFAHQEQVRPKSLGMIMAALGAKPEKIGVIAPSGQFIQRDVWALPKHPEIAAFIPTGGDHGQGEPCRATAASGDRDEEAGDDPQGV